jgi:hypothetical protein
VTELRDEQPKNRGSITGRSKIFFSIPTASILALDRTQSPNKQVKAALPSEVKWLGRKCNSALPSVVELKVRLDLYCISAVPYAIMASCLNRRSDFS